MCVALRQTPHRTQPTLIRFTQRICEFSHFVNYASEPLNANCETDEYRHFYLFFSIWNNFCISTIRDRMECETGKRVECERADMLSHVRHQHQFDQLHITIIMGVNINNNRKLQQTKVHLERTHCIQVIRPICRRRRRAAAAAHQQQRLPSKSKSWCYLWIFSLSIFLRSPKLAVSFLFFFCKF